MGMGGAGGFSLSIAFLLHGFMLCSALCVAFFYESAL